MLDGDGLLVFSCFKRAFIMHARSGISLTYMYAVAAAMVQQKLLPKRSQFGTVSLKECQPVNPWFSWNSMWSCATRRTRITPPCLCSAFRQPTSANVKASQFFPFCGYYCCSNSIHNTIGPVKWVSRLSSGNVRAIKDHLGSFLHEVCMLNWKSM